MLRGSVIHKCIEAYNNGKSWKKVFKKFETEFYKTHFAEEIVEKGDIPKMAREILENYFYYYDDDGLDYLHNEFHFILPLVNGIEIEGYIDAVVQREDDKKIWTKETKTYARSPNREFLLFNGQSAIYTWATSEMGIKTEGTLWDIIKAKEPSRPRFTKTGKLSQAAIDSTPYTLRKGIIEMGLNPVEYEDFINSVSYEAFLFRYPIRLNRKVVKSLMEDTVNTALEIAERGETTNDKNLTRDCSWCSYREICQAELMGMDTDYITKSGFEKRKKEEDIKDEAKAEED